MLWLLLLRLHIVIQKATWPEKCLVKVSDHKQGFFSLRHQHLYCFFGKRDTCSVTKSSLFGFGVGAMLAGIVTGGWMWNAGSPSLTFLSSRRWMTCSTNSLRKSWVVGSYSFLTIHWLDCLEWITLYFSFPGNEERDGTQEWWGWFMFITLVWNWITVVCVACELRNDYINKAVTLKYKSKILRWKS